jgi:hypothetical protein
MQLAFTQHPSLGRVIELRSSNPQAHAIVRSAVLCDVMSDVRYTLAKDAHVFLECQDTDFTLVSVPGEGGQAFLDYLNTSLATLDEKPVSAPAKAPSGRESLPMGGIRPVPIRSRRKPEVFAFDDDYS